LSRSVSSRLAIPSPRWLAAAEAYLQRYTRRHFNAIRIATDAPPPPLAGPTVFYSNHASWWDPIVLLLLIRRHYRDWRFQGPIDRAALERYPWLERLGLFGIEADSFRGSRRLLEAGSELLSSHHAGVVMTAQGRFADIRQRPLLLKPGLSRLLLRNANACAIPIAIEYVFWNERLPEVLVRFGRSGIRASGRTAPAIQADLEDRLESELDALAVSAMNRSPKAFDCLLEGRRGVGLLQDLPLRLRALVRGERFDPSHSAIRRDVG